jgi:hypothetical protein
LRLFIILIVCAVFLGLLYVRLRPYLLLVQRMFRVLRDVRRMRPGAPVQPLRKEAPISDKLVRCAACGTWIPESRAVRLRSSLATYCSHDCLESSATSKRGQQKAV